MTTIAELITASLKISVKEQTRAIVGINKDLIRLLAAEYEFDPELAIAKFLDDGYISPDSSPSTVYVPKQKGKGKGKGKGKKPVDPDAPVKPKKPMHRYMVFTQAMRHQLKEDHPGIKPKEISIKTGELWAELSDEDRVPHIEKAEKLKAEYLEKMAEWKDEMKVYVATKAASSD